VQQADNVGMFQVESRAQVADYAGTGLIIDRHPMHYRRSSLREQGALSAEELRTCRDGEFVRTSGCVITRQSPGTAKSDMFITFEDETNIANVIADALRVDLVCSQIVAV
jgi:DNA polymerase III alpha subunit